jgi:hypothetical protein
MKLMRQFEANARRNRQERPRSFMIGVIAVAVGTAALAVCVAGYLAAIPSW